MHFVIVAAIGHFVGRRHGLEVTVVVGEGLGQSQVPVSLGDDGLMAMAEENDFLGGALKVVFATGQVYISEENQSLLNSTKVVFASSQAYVSEENESLTNSPKVAFASRQTYISAENDFGI